MPNYNSDDELELVYSLTDNEYEDVVCAIVVDESSPSEISEVSKQEVEEGLEYPPIHVMAPMGRILVPSIHIKILTDKYAKPITICVLFDTGVTSSILNPSILPAQYWTHNYKAFETVSREVFETHYLSKRLYLQFFPNLQISHKMISSTIPGRDAIIGWDIIVQLWKHKV